jgi:hypothetical protein
MFAKPAWYTDLERYWKEHNGPSSASYPGADAPQPSLTDTSHPIWPAPDGSWTGPSRTLPFFDVALWKLPPREQHIVFAVEKALSQKNQQVVARLERQIAELQRKVAKFSISADQRRLLQALKASGVLNEFLQEEEDCCECGCCDDEEDDWDDDE